MATTSAIDLERFAMTRGTAYQRHVHREHQLAWASEGALLVEADGRCWVLPPNLALWIPGGVEHATMALRETVLQGIYVDPARVPLVWAEPTVVSVSPLARHLIGHLGGSLEDGPRVRAEAVLLDVLRPVAGGTIELPLPSDPRARDVAELLIADPADPRSLDELAFAVRSSPRTLLRLFVAETGMTFTQWRVHARLQSAMAYLAEGHTVARVADLVGYASPSAFVAAFRRVTGRTPAGYVADGSAPVVARRGLPEVPPGAWTRPDSAGA